MKSRHCTVCENYPGLLLKHYQSTTSHPSPLPEDVVEQWKKAGSPTGLPCKVYMHWKKGISYKATTEEWYKRLSKTLFNSVKHATLSWKVYDAWANGQVYKEV